MGTPPPLSRAPGAYKKLVSRSLEPETDSKRTLWPMSCDIISQAGSQSILKRTSAKAWEDPEGEAEGNG